MMHLARDWVYALNHSQPQPPWAAAHGVTNASAWTRESDGAAQACYIHIPCCDKRRNFWTAISQAMLQQPSSPVWQTAFECARRRRGVRSALLGSCAVVGSSGGLAGSGQGRLIEDHALVFRFNTGAEHTGGAHAEDAGNRTSIWVGAAPHRQRPGECANCEGGASSDSMRLRGCFTTAIDDCAVAMLPRVAEVCSSLASFARTASDRSRWQWCSDMSSLAARHGTDLDTIASSVLPAWLGVHAALGGAALGLELGDAMAALAVGSGSVLSPSTGFLGVGLALAACERVSLFGFANYSDESSAGICDHYYGCEHNQSQYLSGRLGRHDWSTHWHILADLAQRGALRYYAPTRSWMQNQKSSGRVTITRP